MAAPNLEHLLMTIAFVDGIPAAEHPALRKQIHHAFYYHNQGWAVLEARHLEQLTYGLQYMYAVDAANLIELMPDGMSDLYY